MLGDALTLRVGASPLVGCGELQDRLGDATVARAPVDRQSSVGQHVAHTDVRGEERRREASDAARRADLGETLQERRAQPTTVLVILHGQRNLGDVAVVCEVVLRGGDDVAADLRDQRVPGQAPDGSRLETRGVRLRHGREEAEVAAAIGDPPIQRLESIVVVSTPWAEVRRTTVGEHNVGLVVVPGAVHHDTMPVRGTHSPEAKVRS